MKRVNMFRLLALGKSIAFVQGIKQGTKYEEIYFPLDSCRDQVHELLSGRLVQVRTCQKAGTTLIDAISAFVPADFQQALKEDKEKKVEYVHQWRMKNAADLFETVLREELNVSDTYSVDKKGVYSTYDLIESAEQMIAAPLLAKLPSTAAADLRQAGRCLAFETPTAAGFHMLRGVEAVLMEYYKFATKKALPLRMRNWAVYIDAISKTSGHDPKIVALLRHIKDDYRNPVAHPEVVLTGDEAVVLFGVSVSAITLMATALPVP